MARSDGLSVLNQKPKGKGKSESVDRMEFGPEIGAMLGNANG